MGRFDGGLNKATENSKVISDDEVVDPESPNSSPDRRKMIVPALRSPDRIHTPRGVLPENRRGRQSQDVEAGGIQNVKIDLKGAINDQIKCANSMLKVN